MVYYRQNFSFPHRAILVSASTTDSDVNNGQAKALDTKAKYKSFLLFTMTAGPSVCFTEWSIINYKFN